MKKIIILIFLIFVISCREDKSNNILDDQDKYDVELISFKNSITHQNIDPFISGAQINGLSCTVLDVSESQNRVEINLELSLDKSSKFIYNNLVLSINIGGHSVSVPFHDVASNGDTIKKAEVKLSLDKSDGLNDDSRPFVSIAGSVSENLGNGTLGKSSSIFSVWDLFEK